jgi:hypothetical protein
MQRIGAVLFRWLGIAAVASIGTGCAVLSDNGTRLAFALERESRSLIASGQEELVFDYSPLTGINQAYEVRLTKSHSLTAPYGGSVVVTGRDGGGTTYQARFVYIVQAMRVSKFNEATHVTLRNNGGRVEVTSLR